MIESERWKIWWKASVLMANPRPANPHIFPASWYIAARDEKYIIYEYAVVGSKNDFATIVSEASHISSKNIFLQ